MKTGVVLFVKNEVEDIASWIAWHAYCGFSTVIIYDDYSTDGTWEVIHEAAKVFDVRTLRAADADQFNIRQQRTYIDALERFREEFDWLLFLDSDEYLDIRDGSSVAEFLSQYPDANGVALNWCCFGSGGHVIKPPTPIVFENYTTRSEPDFEYNYTTKSFVRPKQTDPVYINPHRFQVNGPYVTTDHQPVSWKDEHPDRTKTLAQWDVARVHHYVIRSAQHYIEKMQRRVDIREAGIGMGLFIHCDRNDHYDPTLPEQTDPMMVGLHRIQQQVNLALLNETVENHRLVAPPASARNSLAAWAHNRFSAHIFQTVHDTTLCYEKGTGRLCHVNNPAADPRVEPLLAIAATLWPNMIFLTTPDMIQPLFTSHDPRVSTVLSFKLERCDDNRVGFRNPITGLLTCFLKSDNLKDTMAGNRSRLQEWEKLEMKSILEPLPADISNLFRTLDYVSAPSSLYPITDPYKTADIFAAAVSLQLPEDFALWRAMHILSNVSWMQRHNPLSV
nr:glycosyltransferase family 2 protein [Gluconobacter cerinus]